MEVVESRTGAKARPGFWITAADDPERVAVIDPDGTRTTYGELEQLVNQISHGLREIGCGRDSVIALATHNHHIYLAMALATGQIGGHLVPVNWHFVPDEVAYMLVDSEAQAVIVNDGLHDVMGEAMDRAGIEPGLRFSVTGARDGYRALSDLIEGHPKSRPDELVAGAVMQYTSGTTGRPKAVRRKIRDVPPEAFVAVVGTVLKQRGLKPGADTWMVPGPVYHSAPGGHACEALYYGNTLVLMDRWDSERALALVAEHRVNHLFIAPIHLSRWLAMDPAIRKAYDVSSLRLVMHAGAPCPVATKRAAIAWLGPILYEYYGGTEGAFTYVTSEQWLAHPGTVGNITEAVPDIKVLSEETGEGLPAGEIGLLYSRMAGLEFAYHHDPEKTAAATREGGYVTAGDLGYVDADGWLYVVDRRTDMILSGGVNIYPAEVESVLLEHVAVADAAVVGAPDAEWGNRLVAFIEPASDVAPSSGLADELAAHCRERLARFKAPREFEFRHELPRSTAGKLLRRALREELAQRAVA